MGSMECLICFNENSSPPVNSHQNNLCDYFCNLFSLDESQYLIDIQESTICSACFNKLDDLCLLIQKVKKIKTELKCLLIESQEKSKSNFVIYNDDGGLKKDMSNLYLRNRICEELTTNGFEFNGESYIRFKSIETDEQSNLNNIPEESFQMEDYLEISWNSENEIIQTDPLSKVYLRNKEDDSLPINDIDDELLTGEEPTNDSKSKSIEILLKEALTNNPIVVVNRLEEMTKMELMALMGFKSPTIKIKDNSNSTKNTKTPKLRKLNQNHFTHQRKLQKVSKSTNNDDNEPKINKVMKCEIPNCNFTNVSQLLLAAHVKRDHEGIVNCYQCSHCDKTFNNKRIYWYHVNKHTRAENPTRHYCDQCEKSYASKQLLLMHFKSKHSPENEKEMMKCDVCEKIISSAIFKMHYKNHENMNKYVCEICGKSFGCNAFLVKHEIKHSVVVDHGRKPFQCDQCERAFDELRYLEDHVRTRHSSEAALRHKCSKCDFKCVMKCELNQHEKRSHTDYKDRPFPCQWENCEKRYLQLGQLNDHMKVHTNERPFACPVCSKGFPTNKRLKEHSLIHESPFTCEFCGRKFHRKKLLQLHVNCHERDVNRAEDQI